MALKKENKNELGLANGIFMWIYSNVYNYIIKRRKIKMTTFEKIADCKLEELDFLDLERMKEEIEEEMKKRLDKITEM